jgi:hypothetical protein
MAPRQPLPALTEDDLIDLAGGATVLLAKELVLKGKVKKALNFVADFEKAVAHEAHKRGYQGVVCGHIHRAEIRDIDGVIYCNDGDWVESRSALVEHMDGSLELVFWNQVLDYKPALIEAREPLVKPVATPNPITASIANTVS